MAQVKIYLFAFLINLFLLNQAIAQSHNTITIEGVEFVFVKGGEFLMGDLWGDGYNNELPVHKVTLGDFSISKYEISNAQYAKFMNEYGSEVVKEGEYVGQDMVYENRWGLKKLDEEWRPQIGYENHPVVCVTWYGANEFCKFYNFELPTEAEWEYAARSGGKKEKWAGTNKKSKLIKYAWFGKDWKSGTHPVGKKEPNELGVYDMSGNAWEWCQDWYDENFYQSCIDNNIRNNPLNTEKSSTRVLRGGSFSFAAVDVRTCCRYEFNPVIWYATFGFRPVRKVSDK